MGPLPRSPYALIGLGLEITVPVLLLLLGGYWLDGRLGSTPWLMVVGAFLGMVVGFYNVVRRVAPGEPDDDGQAD